MNIKDQELHALQHRYLTKIFTPLKTPLNYQIIKKHYTANQIMAFTGEKKYLKYTTFVVIRNPWDQVVSFYEHLRKPLYLKQYKDKLLHPYNACRSAVELTFPKWAEVVYKNRQYQDEIKISKTDHFQCQTAWFYDENNKLLIDFVLRYETLAADFKAMMSTINIKSSLLLHINKSSRMPYKHYYDKHSYVNY